MCGNNSKKKREEKKKKQIEEKKDIKGNMRNKTVVTVFKKIVNKGKNGI